MFCSQLTHLMLSVLIVFTANVSAQELSSTLHTTISGVPVAYDGEVVTFTCVTRNSQTLAWTSDDYIGTGGTRLELIAAEPPGTFRRASTGLANATLINVDKSMTTVLVSELLVRVVSTYQTSNVTCHSVGTDESNTITFYMADVTSVTCNQLSVCPTEPVTCTCVTVYSMMHSWISDEYIGRNNLLDFTSSTSVGTRRNATASNTFAVLVNTSNENDIFVITSNVTVAPVRSDGPVVLTCVNIDRQNSTVILPITNDCRGSPANIIVTTETGNGGTTCTSDNAGIAVLSVFFVILVIISIGLGVVLIIVSYMLFKSNKKIAELEEDLKEKKKQIAGLEGDLKEKKKQVEQLEEDVNDKKQQIQGLKQDKIKLASDLESKDKELKRLKLEMDEKLRKKEEEVNRLLKESREDNQMLNNLEASFARINGENEKLQREIDALQLTLKRKVEAENKLRNESEKLKKEIRKLENKFTGHEPYYDPVNGGHH